MNNMFTHQSMFSELCEDNMSIKSESLETDSNLEGLCPGVSLTEYRDSSYIEHVRTIKDVSDEIEADVWDLLSDNPNGIPLELMFHFDE